MELERLDSVRQINQEFKRIQIRLNENVSFTITESHGELRIHKDCGETISISPCGSNEILVK